MLVHLQDFASPTAISWRLSWSSTQGKTIMIFPPELAWKETWSPQMHWRGYKPRNWESTFSREKSSIACDMSDLPWFSPATQLPCWTWAGRCGVCIGFEKDQDRYIVRLITGGVESDVALRTARDGEGWGWSRGVVPGKCVHSISHGVNQHISEMMWQLMSTLISIHWWRHIH